MKRGILSMLICCTSFVFGQDVSDTQLIQLNEGWSFKQVGTDKWLPAQVPGTVHQDLLRLHMLPNPFYGTNEKDIQWVENEDWQYKTSFNVTADQLQYEGAQMIFEGLDTYADVYLNGSHILKSDNMFIGHTVPVKDILREGENLLQVRFHSPITQTLPQWESNGFNYPADNDHHEKRMSIFTRKAPYHYGWDWGIRMVSSGIWRPIALNFYNQATIDDLHVKQTKLTDQEAILSNVIEVNSLSDATVEAIVTVTLQGKEISQSKQQVSLHKGTNAIQLTSIIDNPVRWMPNGWGKPTLYQVAADIYKNDVCIAHADQRIGLRTLRLVNEPDEHGESYYFEVNGIPMFAKGANYIPSEVLLPQMTDEKYKTLFDDVVAANMNVIRVWGGGIYEDDRFYDLADENGIIVWQDFMFACTVYPGDPAFLKNVEKEAEYNIKRLRNHPSIAMWCGNNEILEGLKYWGWQKKYSEQTYNQFYSDYNKLFKELLPAKVKELDEERFYVHSSPYLANWGRPNSWGMGDSHNWGIWYGKKPFESSDTELGRFISEFGFQSFPEMKTIATFASPEDYEIESEVMNAHQKSSIGNSLIRTYMERDYIVPEKFEDFVYVGLVLQGQGMRHCFEAHRRNRPYCMGTLYWQLNDNWPVVSWSGIDYYGNWKALHYQAQRAFAPLIINPIQMNDSLNVYLLSDKLESLDDLTLEMQQIDFNGKKLKTKRIITNAPANTSKQVFESLTSDWGNETTRKTSFLLFTLKDKSGKSVARDVHFFERTKDLELPDTKIVYTIKQKDGQCEVTLKSSRLAKDVFIQIPIQGARFSDNFFDLLPGETRKIVITSPQIKKNEPQTIDIKHIKETY